MENQKTESFLAPFFSFNFITLFGIAIAFFVVMMSSDKHPVSEFIFSFKLYLASSLLALSIRLLLWIAIDKGTFFEIKNVFWKIIQDIIIINAVILSTLSFIFIVKTFFF